MKFGFVLPRGDARTAADYAREVEAADWDGFFVWEAIWGTDPWVSLSAAAMVTERIRLGTMLTPLPALQPWQIAAITATLDRLSNGRLILSVGLGALDTGWAEFGLEMDRKTRAALLDEGLDILTGLWHGQPYNYDGKHHHIRPVKFPYIPAPPVQQPRIPIWVVGAWPYMKSMRRALKYDGLLPQVKRKGQWGEVTPDDIREINAWIDKNRKDAGAYDIVVEGLTPGDDPVKASGIIRPWLDAGATWWIEAMWDQPPMEDVLKRIRQGPPRIA
jgi:alkanesulfonate monooxygenase SsuD/methylene tetrahydromethanopterin reductase-like flavin-dependent oxidoreductase (luciferase family)